MSTKVMAVNAGSSSLKFKLYQMPEEIVICSGIADRIGHDDGIFKISYDSKTKKGDSTTRSSRCCKTFT